MQDASGEPAHVADNSPAPGTAWHSHPARLIIICGIILIGAVIAATAGLLLNLRDRQLAASGRALDRLALVLAEQIDRSFQSIELIQTAVVERMQSLGIASAEEYERQMSAYDTHQRLKDRISVLPHINAIVLTDTQGKLINFSRSWPVPSVKIPDQDPSEAFKSDPHLTSFVGKPLRSPATGNWLVPIARKLTGPNSEFLGVVTGVMELQYFEQIFGAVAITPNDSIALFRRDGTLLARYPRPETAIGQSLSHSALFVRVLSQSDHGMIRQTGAIDGKERLISARSLGHYPIVVVATTTVAAALADWKRGAIYMTGAALLIGLLIGGVVVFSVWLIGKELREQKVRLDTALSNMSQGLIMFDSAARVVICNDRYRQIYKFPSELVKLGCTALDLIKYRVANKTFSGNPGQYVSDLLATIAHGKTESQELETGDGRTIAVVNHPIAGGGWVATHEDITEKRKTEAEQRTLSEALRQAAEAVLVLDADTRIIYLNPAFYRLFGYAPDEIIGQPIAALSVPERKDNHQPSEVIRQLNEKGIWRDEVWRRAKDGTAIPVRLSTAIIRDAKGDITGYVGTYLDLREARQADQALRESESRLKTVMESVQTGIVIIDPDAHKVVYVNSTAARMIGTPKEDIEGSVCHKFICPAEKGKCPITDLHQTVDHSERVLLTATGAKHPIIKSVTTVMLGGKVHLLESYIDITERKQMEEQLKVSLAEKEVLVQKLNELATHDGLTRLYNHHKFYDLLADELARAQRFNRPFSLLMLDIDHFKRVNDTQGHQAGDAVLKGLSELLDRQARAVDLVCRYGGEEITVILPEINLDAAANVAERLRAAIEAQPFDVNSGAPLRITVSIGVASFPAHADNAQALVAAADAALYAAKQGGRNRIIRYEPALGQAAA